MKIFINLLIVTILLCNLAYGFDDEDTHPRITESSIDYSVLRKYLKIYLVMPFAADTKLPSKGRNTILDLMKKGSTDEDSPLCRASNHFHNPLKAWDQSEMSDEPGVINKWCGSTDYATKYSNITWATGYISQESDWIHRVNQRMGWDDARNYFYKALTSTSKGEREGYFAKTFQALGQVMHLLQDMAVPAHVRNDFWSHLTPTGPKLAPPAKWFDNLFEDYVKRKPGLIAGAGKPEKPAFQKARVTDYWDTTDGLKNPSVDGSSLGLAEVVNLNYFSESTVPNYDSKAEHFFINPEVNESNFQICEDYGFNSNTKRKYLSRKVKGSCPPAAEGRTADYFAAVSLLDPGEEISLERLSVLKYELDPNVHNTYAQELIPLAIGYSAGLLDHFFRGNIEITLPEDGFYSRIEEKDQGRGFTRVTLLARNTTSNDEEMPDGSIQLVVHYKVAQEDPFQSKPVAVSEDFSYIVVPEQKNLRSIPRDRGVLLEFDLTENPIPLYATDVYLQLVYKGKLGLEQDGVAVGFRDISEPTPMVFFNNMDRICLNGSWYPAGSPEAIAQVDENHNQKADGEEWDVYRHNVTDFYLRFSPLQDPRFACKEDYQFHTELIPPGEYVKVYILSDYQFHYSHGEAPEAIEGNDVWWFHYFETKLWEGQGIRNQLDYHEDMEVCCKKLGVPRCKENDPNPSCCDKVVSPGCPIRTYPELEPFRAMLIWGGTILNNDEYPPGSPCPELD